MTRRRYHRHYSAGEACIVILGYLLAIGLVVHYWYLTVPVGVIWFGHRKGWF